jgi:hypothetical protein
MALNLTKNKDVSVINAIGTANVKPLGDANYAVEKLMIATQTKISKTPILIYPGMLIVN